MHSSAPFGLSRGGGGPSSCRRPSRSRSRSRLSGGASFPFCPTFSSTFSSCGPATTRESRCGRARAWTPSARAQCASERPCAPPRPSLQGPPCPPQTAAARPRGGAAAPRPAGACEPWPRTCRAESARTARWGRPAPSPAPSPAPFPRRRRAAAWPGAVGRACNRALWPYRRRGGGSGRGRFRSALCTLPSRARAPRRASSLQIP
mmetsp:Transcript_27649/g.98575  ORF Transcript_27649/g.98575 Transcript_27649/m.98575 type:complete len:205 (-) Transcript_27649:670-1284(-)